MLRLSFTRHAKVKGRKAGLTPSGLCPILCKVRFQCTALKVTLNLPYRNPVILKKKSKVRMKNLRAGRKAEAEASTSRQSNLQPHDKSPLPSSSPLPPLTSSPAQPSGHRTHLDVMSPIPMSDLHGGHNHQLHDDPGSPLPPSSPPSPLTRSLVQFARHYYQQDMSPAPVPMSGLYRGRSGSPTAQYVARRDASRIPSISYVYNSRLLSGDMKLELIFTYIHLLEMIVTTQTKKPTRSLNLSQKRGILGLLYRATLDTMRPLSWLGKFYSSFTISFASEFLLIRWCSIYRDRQAEARRETLLLEEAMREFDEECLIESEQPTLPVASPWL